MRFTARLQEFQGEDRRIPSRETGRDRVAPDTVLSGKRHQGRTARGAVKQPYAAPLLVRDAGSTIAGFEVTNSVFLPDEVSILVKPPLAGFTGKLRHAPTKAAQVLGGEYFSLPV